VEAVKTMGLKLLEIERELSGAGADAALRRYDAVLAALDARVSGCLAAGLAPDDYARAERLREANLIARKILRLAVKEGSGSFSGSTGVNNKQGKEL
jgi:hypothetical protein